MSQLGRVLFTTTQQKVLGLLYGQPQKSFYMNEIIKLTGMGVATIKRELDRMVGAGILRMTKIGNQHHYQANPDCPIYDELFGICQKTFGVTEVIKTSLEPISEGIVWSFIYGSLARAKESFSSDIDLMIIGDVSYSQVVETLFMAQESLHREINPKIYTQKEWVELIRKRGAFIKEVLAKPKINVIGDGHEFR